MFSHQSYIKNKKNIPMYCSGVNNLLCGELRLDALYAMMGHLYAELKMV